MGVYMKAIIVTKEVIIRRHIVHGLLDALPVINSLSQEAEEELEKQQFIDHVLSPSERDAWQYDEDVVTEESRSKEVIEFERRFYAEY